MPPREPHKASKKDPESILPAARPTGNYDPLDRIVQDILNIQSFLAHIEEHPGDLKYLEGHYSKIWSIRNTNASQIDKLAETPYDYSPYHLALLKKENERIFHYLEGAVNAMKQANLTELQRLTHECGKAISKFDNTLSP
jgi:hypothetical protein